MLPKILGVLILTVAIAAFEPTRAYAVPFFIIGLAIVFVIEGVRVVPQQSAWVVERLGRFHATLEPGLNIIVPFIDRVAYRHSLKRCRWMCLSRLASPGTTPSLRSIGHPLFPGHGPRLASYGTSDYITAITQPADHAALGGGQDGAGQDAGKPRHDQQADRIRASTRRAAPGRKGAALRNQEPHTA